MDAVIHEDSRSWRFTGIYGKPIQERRRKTWDLIERFHSVSNLPWILGGGFSEILSDSEKLGGAPRRQSIMQDFRDIVDSCGLVDPSFTGDIFTWCDGRTMRQPIWERLDKFLINSNMIQSQAF